MWVRHRIAVRWHRAAIRFRALGGTSAAAFDPPSPPAGSLWHVGATPPGHDAAMPWGSAPAFAPDPESEQFLEVMDHRFRVLAPRAVPFEAADANERRQRMAPHAVDLPARFVAEYSPIEWHADVHCGYRWDPGQLYIDVRLAPVPGADIKIPRELSRFNHVGALARGDSQRGAIEFTLQALDWIAANPPGRGANWACTMDVALRALNWIWALRLFEPQMTLYPTAMRAIRASLWQHGSHIEDHLEYYEELTNNHYLSDIAGLLYVAAAFPEFPEADRWLRFSLQELVSEMERETLADGASHEASTHYHRLVAELFASCAALAERLPPARRQRLAAVDPRDHRVRPRLRPAFAAGLNLESSGPLLPAAFYERLALMAEFTAALTKPNGRVPQFGDNDSGRAHKLSGEIDVRDHRHVTALIARLTASREPEPADAAADAEAELIAGGLEPASAKRPEARSFFEAAGVGVLRNARAWLAVTCGANGLGGRGGHGHNDKLSFELNVDGIDFIVDGGCPAYTGNPPLRNRFRSTAAHSTLLVAGLEQDPLPAGDAGLFRLPERCHPRLAAGPNSLIGSHDGYGSPHVRSFTLNESELIVDDSFTGEGENALRFNLDPEVTVNLLPPAAGDQRFTLSAGAATLRVRVSGAAAPRVVEGCFSVGYGVPVATRAVELARTAAASRTIISWK